MTIARIEAIVVYLRLINDALSYFVKNKLIDIAI